MLRIGRARGAALYFRRRVVDQLQHHHLRPIALSRADTNDPRVAAGAVLILWRDMLEQMLDRVINGTGTPPRLDRLLDVAASGSLSVRALAHAEEPGAGHQLAPSQPPVMECILLGQRDEFLDDTASLFGTRGRRFHAAMPQQRRDEVMEKGEPLIGCTAQTPPG